MGVTKSRFGRKELGYIKEALDSGLKGTMNQRLESEFARKFDIGYAVGVNSGTSALHCCLAAAGVRPGDEVIVPPLTFASTAFSVMYLGGIPVFADVDPKTFTIDPKDVQRKVTNRTKAIIPVALYGLSSDMDPIMDLARRHNLTVIEDCAQCYLGTYKGRLAGTLGDMAIFSFERSKHITSGNGGMIITNNANFAETARKFSVLGYSTLRADAAASKPSKEVIQDPDFDRHKFIAPNYRLPELCAAMALAQFERIDDLVKMRVNVARAYEETVRDCSWLVPQDVPSGFGHTYWTYAMKLAGDAKGISWRMFRKTYLEEGGEPFYAAWKMTYLEPALLGMKLGSSGATYGPGLCPVAEELQRRMIQLKTNFTSIRKAEEQASSLRKTIRRLEK
jgi:perosamine synthetase